MEDNAVNPLTNTTQREIIAVGFGPPPTPPWSLNEERAHGWRWRQQRVEAWHSYGWAMAHKTNLRGRVRCRPATITVTLPVGTRRRRDPSNFLPAVKALIDGCVAARVWPDDDARYVSVAEPVLTHGDVVAVRIEPREETTVS